MTPEEIKNSVSECKSEISNLETKISDLQNQCKHNEIDIKNVNNSGSFSLRNICKYCGKVVGYPKQEDLKKAGY